MIDRKLLTLLLVITLTTLTTSQAFAQNPAVDPIDNGMIDGITEDTTSTPYDIAIIFSVFIVASVGRVILAWQHKKRIVGIPFDWEKFGKALIAGVVLGAIVAGYLLLTDDSTSKMNVVDFEGYKNMVIWAFPLLVTTMYVLKKIFPNLVDTLQKMAGTADQENTDIPENIEEPEPIDDDGDIPPGKTS